MDGKTKFIGKFQCRNGPADDPPNQLYRPQQQGSSCSTGYPVKRSWTAPQS